MTFSLLIMAPFALIGLNVTRNYIVQKWKNHQMIKDAMKYRPYEYDINNPMVQRFQYLAGIKGGLYSCTRESLRDRFNRIRSTCYSVH